MRLRLKAEELQRLRLIMDRPKEDIVELCRTSYEYLINDESSSKKFESVSANENRTDLNTMEALISLLIEILNADESDISKLQQETKFKPEALEVVLQFLSSQRRFLESSIKSANLRAYRIVNIEWRLENKFASRCLLKQHANVFVIMKLYLHTEPRNENRDLLTEGNNNIMHPDERRNRKDILVQTDITSLLRIMEILEEALFESRSRRVRNIVSTF